VKRAGPTADPLSEAASRTFPCCLLGRRGKLCLVLDLDHTLLNSATFAEVGPALHEALDARAASEAATLPPDQRLLFRLDAIKMWTKLRPGVHSFLLGAARYYQLWIHTNGNRAYADCVVRLLDPRGELFGDRIIAQVWRLPGDGRRGGSSWLSASLGVPCTVPAPP
jgi:hypothetical protein